MKAELTSGEIVTLAKECECVTHNEPHWVHMDRTSRELNWREGVNGRDFLWCMGVGKEEVPRLQAKRREFERRGIVRLIPEASDELTESQRAENRNFAESYARELQARIDARDPKPVETLAEQSARTRREILDRKAEVQLDARRRL